MKRILPLIPALLVRLIVLLSGGLLWWRESEVLFRAQELSLFLPTRSFYDSLAIYPGGTLSWMGAWATQFFFHPALGVGMLILAWLLIVQLCIGLFRLRGAWQGLALLPVLALLAALSQTGYWIYYMKLPGHLWVPTLGVLVALLQQVPARWLGTWGRRTWMLAVAMAGYPLFGAWSFLPLALLALHRTDSKGASDKGQSRIVYTMGLGALGAVLVAAVPPLWCYWSYPQTLMSEAWAAGMPSFQMGTTDCPEYRWAYYALFLSFVPMILVQGDKPSSPWGGLARWGTVTALLVLGAWGVNQRWYRDTNFRKEVMMTNRIERNDWEGALRVMRDATIGPAMPPTRLMVMLKNLALFRLGRIGDEMFHYPEGCEPPHAPWEVRLTQTGGKMLYYHYGKEQFCYRWCMEDGVEFGWSVHALKYLAKSSLVTHDWEVARKYLRLLKQTCYHRAWAEHYEQFLEQPERMAEDEELKPIVMMSQFSDRLDGDKTLVELYLMQTFAHGQGADPYYQEMTLVCALILQDINLFWPRFRQYVNMHQGKPGFRVPTHYQEAAFLYSMLEPQRPSELWPGITNAEAAQRIPFDHAVKQRYQDFMNFNTQCGSMTEVQKKKAFLPQFGDTFYYYYFLVREQKTN